MECFSLPSELAIAGQKVRAGSVITIKPSAHPAYIVSVKQITRFLVVRDVYPQARFAGSRFVYLALLLSMAHGLLSGITCDFRLKKSPKISRA